MKRLRTYLDDTPPALIFADSARIALLVLSIPLGYALVGYFGGQSWALAPLHRRLTANPAYATPLDIYRVFWCGTVLLNVSWITSTLRNFIAITIKRRDVAAPPTDEVEEQEDLPPYPYTREGFAVVLGELQARDGRRLPNRVQPDLHGRWLILSLKAMVTGLFTTGGIGSGKTASLAYPVMEQMIGHERPVKVIDRPAVPAQGLTPGRPEEYHIEKYKWSGILLDEKGDFYHKARQYAAEWGREDDMILIRPDGPWKWNVIYNPNIPDWAVAYQMSWILKNVNKGLGGNDPFWEQKPREVLTDTLTLVGDASGYYTILEYLTALVDEDLQNVLHERGLQRLSTLAARSKGNHYRDLLMDAENRWKRFTMRRKRMSKNLMGSLEACATAGLDMFDKSALKYTFCPTKEEYYTGPCCPWPKRIPRDELEELRFNEEHENGRIRPQQDVFTGFDQILDYGKIVGLEMNKQTYFDAAIFIQVALKTQWMDAVMRRDVRDSTTGKLIIPPRFGEKIGYCPTFLIADECQANATPRDQEFMAQCRSKLASCVFLTQSHTSILDAFGQGKEKAAEAFFQNTMTHLYFRQSDIKSMKLIQEEVGLKDVAETSVAVTEGGRETHLSYVQGDFVNEAGSVSETKTVNVKEKPFFKIEELKQLPDFVSIVLPSTGSSQLPATVCYMRPPWVFEKFQELKKEQSYFDWPHELRRITTLENLPQEVRWDGFGVDGVSADSLTSSEDQMGAFVHEATPEPPPEELAYVAGAVTYDSEQPELQITFPTSPSETFLEEDASPLEESQETPANLDPHILREAERLAKPSPLSNASPDDENPGAPDKEEIAWGKGDEEY